jgi:hypothetical protein
MLTGSARGGLRMGPVTELLTYLSRMVDDQSMGPETVRTSIDIPRDLHRKLHEAAAKKGCSARQLILLSVTKVVEETQLKRPRRRLSLKRPIVTLTGKPFDLSNEQIYDLIGFP